MNITTMRWWIIFCASMFMLAILAVKGLLFKLWGIDQSHIAVLTLGCYLAISSYIGWLTYKLTTLSHKDPQYLQLRSHVQPCWLSSELLMGLGMIGTLIGFILMTGSALSSFNPADAGAAKMVIINTSGSISTAIITTLTGLASSLLVKIQMSNLGIALENDDEESF